VKILFIHNCYKQSGGEDVVVDSECSLLIEKGHNVDLLRFYNKPIEGFYKKFKTAFSSFFNYTSSIKLKKKIKEFKPDIIHVHNIFFAASPSVFFTSYRLQIPVVITLHNYRLICANALLLRNNSVCELCINKKFPLAGIRYKCYRNSVSETTLVTMITGIHKLIGTWQNKITCYIALNEFSRTKLLHSSLGIPENKMVTKPNFAADPGETKLLREDFFLFAGRIVKEKGVHLLLKAFAATSNQNIIIAGDGPEKNTLELQYRNYSNISFTGYLTKTEITGYMKRCKAFICPSIWYEGAPLTIIEAFATGTPVIASRLGSMLDTITDGYDGLHFTAGDENDLRQKILNFLKITEINDQLYKNARQTYLEKYHPEIHYKSIMQIYKQAIEKN